MARGLRCCEMLTKSSPIQVSMVRVQPSAPCSRGDWRPSGGRDHSPPTWRIRAMAKWTAGIVGTVITGAVLWLLTNTLFPRWFLPRPAPPPVATVQVVCSANPATLRPGGDAEITVTVTRGGEPIEGAAVELHNGSGLLGATGMISGNTYSGGV